MARTYSEHTVKNNSVPAIASKSFNEIHSLHPLAGALSAGRSLTG